MPDNYTPLFSEILTRLGKIKSKKDKVTFLKQHNTDALRMIIKASFDPKVNGLYRMVRFHLFPMMLQKVQSIMYYLMKQESYTIISRAAIHN